MTIRVLQGDCRDVLPTLAANSVHCVVTSPPYYGLRDYGTAQWDGGAEGCDHLRHVPQRDGSSSTLTATGGPSGQWPHLPYRDTCGKCGARRTDRQLGLEATPDEYIQTMVAVFREVRRVLRDDGTCWVNMGDSYAHGASGGGSVFDSGRNDGRVSYETDKPRGRGAFATNQGLADKQLLMMPARLALALQADGWWLRSDIIWAKPNPMPESVTDRPTSAHEHVFLLTKSARYYYDADAVREEAEYGFCPETRSHFDAFGAHVSRTTTPGKGGTRNLRNVWTIATHAYPEAHFATFPPTLAETCIKAGTSERGCCAQCGAPWVRQTEAERYATRPGSAIKADDSRNDGGRADRVMSLVTTTGWLPSCQCDAPTKPCVVLDPFAGAGTTMLVADRLQRHAIGIELNEAYAVMARNRIVADAPLFAEVAD